MIPAIPDTDGNEFDPTAHRLSIKALRDVLTYDHETGFLYWNERQAEYEPVEGRRAWWNNQYAGKRALNTRNRCGYLHGTLFRKTHLAHRVAWAIFYGEWPDQQIDHINHIRADNRIVNLRAVSAVYNLRNTSCISKSNTGFLGIYKRPHGSFHARIGAKFIGAFTDLDAAVEARKNAELALGYHENHGLTELVDARAEGRPVSFKVPSAVFHEDGVSRD